MAWTEVFLVAVIYLSGAWSALGMARNVINTDTNKNTFSNLQIIGFTALSWPGFIYLWLKYAEQLWDD